MNELSSLLKNLRGKESLRDASKRANISHNYLSILEKGIDPQTKAPVNPSPETLKRLAKAYNYPYEQLMFKAGYLLSPSTGEIVINDLPLNYDTLTPKQKKLMKEIEELDDETIDFLDGILDRVIKNDTPRRDKP